MDSLAAAVPPLEPTSPGLSDSSRGETTLPRSISRARVSGVLNDPSVAAGATPPMGLGSSLYPPISQIRIPRWLRPIGYTFGVNVPDSLLYRKEVHIRVFGQVPEVHVGRWTVAALELRSGHPKSRFTIGAYTSVAGATVLTGSDPLPILTLRRLKRSMLKEVEPAFAYDLHIGHDVLIGYQSVLMEDTVVSDGAIVGARSLVKGIVPPYAIVAGSPAKIIGYRFPPEEVEMLLRSRWWELPEPVVRSQIPLLYSKDVRGLLAFTEKYRREHPPS